MPNSVSPKQSNGVTQKGEDFSPSPSLFTADTIKQYLAMQSVSAIVKLVMFTLLIELKLEFSFTTVITYSVIFGSSEVSLRLNGAVHLTRTL